ARKRVPPGLGRGDHPMVPENALAVRKTHQRSAPQHRPVGRHRCHQIDEPMPTNQPYIPRPKPKPSQRNLRNSTTSTTTSHRTSNGAREKPEFAPAAMPHGWRAQAMPEPVRRSVPKPADNAVVTV